VTRPATPTVELSHDLLGRSQVSCVPGPESFAGLAWTGVPGSAGCGVQVFDRLKGVGIRRGSMFDWIILRSSQVLQRLKIWQVL